MDLANILKLIDAGFTKTDIMKLTGNDEPASPEPASPEAAPEPASPEPASPEPDITQQILKGITGQLQALTTAVQLKNIRDTDAPSAGPDSTEDIIKSMFETVETGKKGGK